MINLIANMLALYVLDTLYRYTFQNMFHYWNSLTETGNII